MRVFRCKKKTLLKVEICKQKKVESRADNQMPENPAVIPVNEFDIKNVVPKPPEQLYERKCIGQVK